MPALTYPVSNSCHSERRQARRDEIRIDEAQAVRPLGEKSLAKVVFRAPSGPAKMNIRFCSPTSNHRAIHKMPGLAADFLGQGDATQ